MTFRSRLFFSNVALHFIYTFYPETSIDVEKLKEKHHDWVFEEEIIEPRLFHKRYIQTVSPLNKITFPPFKIDGIDIALFSSIAWPQGSNKKSIFQQFVEEKAGVLCGKNMLVCVYTYPESGIVFDISLNLDGDYKAEHLIALINGLLDFNAKLILNSGMKVRLEDLLKDVYNPMLELPSEELDYFETFSIIVPQELKPSLANIDDYFEEPYIQDLYATLIRRGLQFQDIRIDLLKKVKNIALYKSDIVTITYHNMFCYLKGQLSLDFYIGVIRTLKIMLALLHYYDIKAYNEIKKLKTIPRKLGKIKETTQKLETLQLDISRILDCYRMLTTVSATRARMLFEHVIRIFQIRDIEKNLKDKMDRIDDLLSKEYNLRIQKYLQWLAITVAIFTLVITLINVLDIDKLRMFILNFFSNLNKME